MDNYYRKDNSLDIYSAVFNVPLQYTESPDFREGGAIMYALGNSRASVFKKHLSTNAKDSWDEIMAVTEQGEASSYRLAFQEGQINQAWAVGKISL